jgi:glycosyltransferase involved in cell wall biosynthesis
VINQKDVVIEHIIQDNQSTDDSISVITKYLSFGHNIKLFSEQDFGPADALNRAILKAKGDYLIFLNSDDVLEENVLAKVLKMVSQSNADIYLGCGKLIDAENRLIRRHHTMMYSPRLYAFGASVPLHQSTVFTKNFLERCNLQFNNGNFSCWDSEFLIDAIKLGAKLKIVSMDIGNFRIHKDSITGTGRVTENYRAEQLRLFNYVMGRNMKRTDSPASLVLRLMMKLLTACLHRHD